MQEHSEDFQLECSLGIKGVVTIKQAKKNVKWALKIVKIGKLIFSHSYECQGIQIKNSFDKILSLNFNLGPLKMNTYCVRLNQFCKGLSKGFI